MTAPTLLDRVFADEITYPQMCRAPLSVSCPKCKACPGWPCESTGGGNPTFVFTHKARAARLAAWSTDEIVRAAGLVEAQGHRSEMPDGYYADTEAAAAPIPSAKTYTPRGVPLSANQAEEIERAAANNGRISASTAHFHGDHQHRQSVQALERKGILKEAGLSPDGYDRRYELTEFGWQVYGEHRLIIGREPVGGAA